jgi:hypothetical protein
MDKTQIQNLIQSLRATGHAETAKSSKAANASTRRRIKKPRAKKDEKMGELFTSLVAVLYNTFGQMLEEYNRANFDMLCKLMTDFIAGMTNIHQNRKLANYEGEEETDFDWDDDDDDDDEDEEEEELDLPPKTVRDGGFNGVSVDWVQSPNKRRRKAPSASGPPPKRKAATQKKAVNNSKKKKKDEAEGEEQRAGSEMKVSSSNGLQQQTVKMGGSNSAFLPVVSSNAGPSHTMVSGISSNNPHMMSPSVSSANSGSQLVMPGNVSVVEESPSTMSYVHATNQTMFNI